MSQIRARGIAPERLEEAVKVLRAFYTWQRTAKEIQHLPLERLTLVRKIDQARARGQNGVVNDLLLDLVLLDQRREALQHRNLRLEREHGIDGLTGVANRTHLDNALRQEWCRCGCTRNSLAIVFVDLDQFKAIHDDCGHRAGDALLVGLGQQSQRVIRRAGDLVGRYGGDEFVVVLPATDVEEAAASPRAYNTRFREWKCNAAR